MKLREVLDKVENFKMDSTTENHELTLFFDDIGDRILNLGELGQDEKEKAIKSLFEFQKRQPPELDVNWTFIHLIEYIGKPAYKIYNRELVMVNEEAPSLISILLLNRHINSLGGTERKSGVNLLKRISEKEGIPQSVRDEAMEFYEFQLNKEKKNRKTKGAN